MEEVVGDIFKICALETELENPARANRIREICRASWLMEKNAELEKDKPDIIEESLTKVLKFQEVQKESFVFFPCRLKASLTSENIEAV